MRPLALDLGWRDLRASGRTLWVFSACLMLGVCLIAASGALYSQVSNALLADTRALFGGDLEVRDREPLASDALDWMRSRGEVSLLIELRTMMTTGDGRVQLVEMQSFDESYPLYGTVELTSGQTLREALALREGRFGAAIDPVLSTRLGLGIGDTITLGDVDFAVRAIIERQPDRSLRADWRGPPVLVDADALPATNLVQPGSRLAYRYRVKTGADADTWRTELTAAFPDASWEVRTFAERSERLAKVLGQIGSGLLLIGFSALFIGGLGVFNSVHAYLQRKLATIATLQALGMRDGTLAWVYVSQILFLAAAVSIAGVALGAALGLLGASLVAEKLPLTTALSALSMPLTIAWLFGVLTALTFAMPALGRALSVRAAVLFRGIDGAATRTPARYWLLTGLCAAVLTGLVLLALPDPVFAFGFVAVVIALLVLLDGMVRVLRFAARRIMHKRLLSGNFAMHLALANLCRSDSALRVSLLSLGSAVTLLVASALVVGALLRAINDTIPEQAPALVLYDMSTFQLDPVRAAIGETATLERVDLAPLVLGRLSHVNGEALRESGDTHRRQEARDEHKLSYRANNFDQVVIDRGAWWPDDYSGPPLVAMEDREADQLGLQVGDRLQFEIMGQRVEADLVAIYSQRRLQTRFWLEGIFSDGVLDPFITRYVGTVYLDPREASSLQERIAAIAPNVVTLHTERVLDEARLLLGRASSGLAAIACVSLAVSLLVLVSVVASSRVRHVYNATVLHTLGARIDVIRRALQAEYALLALLTSVFAIVLGGAIAVALLTYRLELEVPNVWWLGAVTAVGASSASLALGARYLLRQLRLSPALLLRTSG